MPYNEQDPNKLKFTGLWLRERQGSGDKFYASTTLRQEDVDELVEFLKKPSKIMIFPNTYKKSDRHPDASIFVYHVDENWKSNRQQQQQPQQPIQPEPPPEPQQRELEDAPF